MLGRLWSGLKGLFGARDRSQEYAAEQVSRSETHWQALLADWPYPVRLVPGVEATAAWHEEAAIGAREGFSPILISPRTSGIPDEAADYAAAEVASPDTIVDIYFRQLIYRHWAMERPEAGLFPANYPEEMAAALAASPDLVAGGAYAYDAPLFADVQELPVPPAPERYLDAFGAVTSFELEGPFPQVAITRLPTPDSWRAPLLFGFGGWNACPRPAELAAFARRWKQLYGADIAAITDDTVEFVVARPPATFEEATRLAKEHNIVGLELGDMDMSEYIASLRWAPRWLFWWD